MASRKRVHPKRWPASAGTLLRLTTGLRICESNILIASSLWRSKPTKGALISAILEHEDITIYPINPTALGRLPKSLCSRRGERTIPMMRCSSANISNTTSRSCGPLKRDQPVDARKLADSGRGSTPDLLINALLTAMNSKPFSRRIFPRFSSSKLPRIYADFIIAFLQKYPQP